MRSEVGDLFVGPMMAVFGLIGLVMYGRAEDGAIAIFGASLAAFSVIFVFGLIKRHYDRIDAAHAFSMRAEVQGDIHG